MLAKFSGFNRKGPYPTLEKEKETICVVFTYSVKRARKIRKFHVAVVQRQLRNVQKKKREETCKVVVLLTKPIGFWFLVFVLFCYFSFFLSFFFILFFCRSRYCRRSCCLISAQLLSRNLATMVT